VFDTGMRKTNTWRYWVWSLSLPHIISMYE